jgi:hypothetical protein
MFLRVTWHPEHSAFVVSHWQGAVCVAATRVAATEVADVVSLLTNGLADALSSAQSKPPQPQSRPRRSPRGLWRRLWWRRQRRGSGADVIAFPERAAPDFGHELRWKSRDG